MGSCEPSKPSNSVQLSHEENPKLDAIHEFAAKKSLDVRCTTAYLLLTSSATKLHPYFHLRCLLLPA